MMAAADEPANVIKAAAVAGGQFYGSRASNAPYGVSPYVAVEVPAVFAHTYFVASCFRTRPSTPATCAPPVGGSAQLVRSTPTWVAIRRSTTCWLDGRHPGYVPSADRPVRTDLGVG